MFYVGNHDSGVLFENNLCVGHFPENELVLFGEPRPELSSCFCVFEMVAIICKHLVFSRTGSKRKVLRPFRDEVTFQEFPKS